MSTLRLCAYRLGPLSHPYLIERLRVIYNGARADLSTRPLREHTPESQLAWWEELDHKKVTVHLYSFRTKPWSIMGYSMVTDRGIYSTTMHAVAEEYRGCGFSGEMMDHMYALTHGRPLVATSLSSNKSIRRWNTVKGWKLYTEAEGVQYLYLPNGTSWPEAVYHEIVADYMERTR